MIVRTKKDRPRSWYEADQDGLRIYSAAGISRVVGKEGSYWRLTLGPLLIAWGFKMRRGERRTRRPVEDIR